MNHDLQSWLLTLTSRWSIRRLWQKANPRSNWKRKSFTLRGCRPPGCRSKYCERSVCWNYKKTVSKKTHIAHISHSSDCLSQAAKFIQNIFVRDELYKIHFELVPSSSPLSVIKKTVKLERRKPLVFFFAPGGTWLWKVIYAFHYVEFDRLTRYSKTNVRVDRVCTMSWSITILECFRSFKRDASRMAVNGVPSSSWGRISFRATTWFVRLKIQQDYINFPPI